MTTFRSGQLLWLWLVSATLAVSLTAFAATKTCTGATCTPYITAANGGVGCLRKNPINLRFMLHMAQENDYTIGTEKHHTATYGFTPCVDDLTALNLNAAPFLSSGYAVTSTTAVTTYYFTANASDKYLSVYGFGMSNLTTYPEHGISSGAVLVSKNGQDACGDASNIGVVTMLSLSVGMHNGFFNYVGQSGSTTTQVTNPNYNAALCGSSSSGTGHTTTTTTTTTTKAPSTTTSSSDSIDYCSKTITVAVPATNVQPAKVGFTPTCNAKDQCLMGDPNVYTCIGNVTGQKNCGLCYSNATLLATNASLTVWVSYVGTDRKSTVLTSSGDNPLNYMNYVRNGAFTTFTNKFHSLIKGNLSDFGLVTKF